MTAMFRNTRAALYLIFAILAVAGCGGGEAQHAWLHGRWELSFNPDNDDADVLTFHKDGTVAVDTVDGRTVSGKYAVLERQVALTLVSNQKIVDVTFAVSPDQSRLIYENGAYYTRKTQ